MRAPHASCGASPQTRPVLHFYYTVFARVASYFLLQVFYSTRGAHVTLRRASGDVHDTPEVVEAQRTSASVELADHQMRLALVQVEAQLTRCAPEGRHAE